MYIKKPELNLFAIFTIFFEPLGTLKMLKKIKKLKLCLIYLEEVILLFSLRFNLELFKVFLQFLELLKLHLFCAPKTPVHFI